jgi:hypothetical protein
MPAAHDDRVQRGGFGSVFDRSTFLTLFHAR